MQDIYLRLSAGGGFETGAAEHADGLVFVDVQADGDPARLRTFPKSFFRNVRHLLFRLSEAGYRQYRPDFDDLQRRLGLNAEFLILRQKVGQKPRIENIGRPSRRDDADILRRARRVELLALLEIGGGLWRPSTHHYLLPSGEHSDLFVDLGAALRTPHDCHVIALWLSHFMSNRMALIIDTSRLTPLALAIECLLSKSSMELGKVIVLEDYPRTLVDLRRAIRDSVNSKNLLAIISVSSSGNLRDLLTIALGQTPGVFSQDKIVTLLDLQQPQSFPAQEDVWANVGDLLNSRKMRRHTPDKCELCSSHEHSALVPIDARTFDAYFPTLIEKVMPDLGDPSRNRDYWEVCSRLKVITLHDLPEEHVRDHRAKEERLAIKINVRALVSSPEFHRVVVQQLQKRESRDGQDWQKSPKLADLLLVPNKEMEWLGYEEFLESLRPWLLKPQGQIRSFNLRSDFSKDAALTSAIRDSEIITVFTFGTISGYSLQFGLLGVQAVRRDADDVNFELQGFIVHARPRKKRDWETLRNSFASNLFCVWLSYIPEGSIIAHECELLRNIDLDTAEAEIREFVLHRLSLLVQPSDEVFWGAPPNIRLSPHSLYGEGLSPAATLVAVGAALEARRDVAAPARKVFPIEDFMRSYFDPLIICSFLRHIRPGECWWGQGDRNSEMTVTSLLHREHNQATKRMLCAELLLAAAQGKVPSVVKRALIELAEQHKAESVEIRTGLTLLQS